MLGDYLTRELFLLYSRPLYRTCEILCNHTARVLAGGSRLDGAESRAGLGRLNEQRIGFQRQLQEIGASHSEACAECKGKCCGGPRERDAFIDRILQDPETPHRGARRRSGQMAAYKVLAQSGPGPACPLEAEHVDHRCPELTTEGCRIPYELRPIQCVAYFCSKAVDQLSREERRRGVRALAGLMGIQLGTVLLALRSRPSRQKRR